MKNMYKKTVGTLTLLIALPNIASAQAINIGIGGGGRLSSVPEIDASTGAMALAALGAALLLTWEINRRRNSA